MRPRLRRLAAIALVGLIFAFLASSCTVLGFGAGAIVDQVRPTRYDSQSPGLVTGTSLKTPAILVMRDSTRIAGRYYGVEPDETADSTVPSGSGKNPQPQRIAILASDGTITQVAVDSIASLSVAAPKHGKLVGGLLGLLADVWVVVYLAYYAQWD